MFHIFYILILPLGVNMWKEPETSLTSSSPCRPDLCPPETISLGCITSKIFSKDCGSGNRIVHVNGMLRQGVLQEINFLRNLVASGLFNLSAASRMPTMGWDHDLAHLASVALRQCDLEGRFCANTKEYHYVATTEISSPIRKLDSLQHIVLKKLLPIWLADVLGCRMDSYHRILPLAEGRCVGHYVPLIEENGNRMGCALRERSIPANATAMVTLLCHFSRANVNNMQPYEVGTIPGANCNSGKSRLYKYLCNPAEIVDPNYVNTNLNGNIEEDI